MRATPSNTAHGVEVNSAMTTTMMTETAFVEELSRLFMELDHDWDFGNEICGEAEEILDLCKCYLTCRKKWLTEDSGPPGQP
jgi:hypothetical protein